MFTAAQAAWKKYNLSQHYPTDINLLYDAMRKVITLIASLNGVLGLCGWRQSAHNVKTVKKSFRKAQQVKRSTSKDPKKKKIRDNLIINAHQAYIDMAADFIRRAKETLKNVNAPGFLIGILKH